MKKENSFPLNFWQVFNKQTNKQTRLYKGKEKTQTFSSQL